MSTGKYVQRADVTEALLELTDMSRTEDAAHASGDNGIMALAVRKDTAAALAGTDGDYAPLEVDASGRLHVNAGATTLTNVEKAEDAAHVTGDKGIMALAVRKDTVGALAGTDGDYIPLTTDSSGRLWVAADIQTGDIEIGAVEIKNATDDTRATVGANGLYVDVRAQAALPAGTNNIGDVDIASALPAGTNNIGDVDIASALPAGTNNIGDVDVASLPAGNLGQQLSAASLSVTLATNIADTTYIGDIKFGESLPAGTNNIGDVDIASALPAGTNNIGDVDVASLPAGNLGQQLSAASLSVTLATDVADATYVGDIKFGESLPAGTNAIGKLAANSGVDIGDVDVASIAAGDNNIGNVDIVTLPAGNLGMQLMAASLSVVPASNITDATYIGDIKFGESLPAGTNAIGKLAANTGVDIGDVDITSIAAGDNNIGNVDIASAIPAGTNTIGGVMPVAATSGGATPQYNVAVDDSPIVAVKASAGQLYSVHLFNNVAAVTYAQFFNVAAGSVVLGTTVPDFVCPVAASTYATYQFPVGVAFGTAISVACTTTPTGAVGASCDVGVSYK